VADGRGAAGRSVAPLAGDRSRVPCCGPESRIDLRRNRPWVCGRYPRSAFGSPRML